MERLVQLAAEAERGYQEDREALVQIILAARRRARKLRTRMRSLAKSLRPWVDAGMPEDGRRVDAAREYVQMAKDLRDCRLADLHGCETLRDLREKVP
jgi:hypothetical protein